ncbi:hypothetical protein [Streptomyces sp. NPDC018045]|uniref:hypothetical protein n=1 Tax=Streptomyces sp. NPDC018045 TaxID=3365037 RepID=UPI0037BDB82F
MASTRCGCTPLVGMVWTVMAVCRSFEMHREPVGKRIKAAAVLADDPDGDAASHRMM